MHDKNNIMQDASFRMGFNIIFRKIQKLIDNNTELRDKNNKVCLKLVEAKEIIKGLLPCASNHIFNDLPRFDEEVELYHKAEAFIKEE